MPNLFEATDVCTIRLGNMTQQVNSTTSTPMLPPLDPSPTAVFRRRPMRTSPDFQNITCEAHRGKAPTIEPITILLDVLHDWERQLVATIMVVDHYCSRHRLPHRCRQFDKTPCEETGGGREEKKERRMKRMNELLQTFIRGEKAQSDVYIEDDRSVKPPMKRPKCRKPITNNRRYAMLHDCRPECR